jgi:hypothetical protein
MDRQAIYHLVSIILQTLAGTGAIIVMAIVLVGIVCVAFFVRLIVGKTKRRGN